MGKTATKIKLFKKILKDLLTEFNKANKTNHHISVKTIDILRKFEADVKIDSENFINCDPVSLKNLSLFKDNDIDLMLSDINWGYVHSLYFSALQEPPNEEILKKSRDSIANNLIKKKTTTELPLQKILGNPSINNIISDILPMVTKALEGKDVSKINPNELVEGIMTNDVSKCGGIDFSNIISATSQKVNEKLKSGELKLDKK